MREIPEKLGGTKNKVKISLKIVNPILLYRLEMKERIGVSTLNVSRRERKSNLFNQLPKITFPKLSC